MLKIAGGILLALVVIGALASHAFNNAKKQAGIQNSSATEVEFIVNGSAPNGVDITYGSNGSNYQGHLPLDTTLPIDTQAMYYDVTAQLSGGGRITCKVIIGSIVRTGHAAGGYNICSAQLNSILGGWG